VPIQKAEIDALISGKARTAAYAQPDGYPPLVAACLTNVASAKVGEVVTFTCQGAGGNGYYSFAWTGTDGLNSNYQTVSIKYNSPGEKIGEVEITSNNTTIQRTCSVLITE
jgi:hypothetical protein